MRILLTGGSGFIGSHLRTELELAGHVVFNIDLQAPMATDREACSDLLDVSDDGQGSWALDTGLAAWQPDVVVHLAAQVGRLFGEDDLLHTIRSNALMTALVARSCAAEGIPLMYTSTSEIYGDLGTLT